MSIRKHRSRGELAAYPADFPGVAHIVADLDDLLIAAPRRIRRPSMIRRGVRSLMRRLIAYRRVVALAVVMAVAACGGSDDPLSPDRAVASVEVTPLAIVLEEGATLQLKAIALDSTGWIVTGRRVWWVSDAPNVVAVSAVGRIRAVGQGYAAITATIDGRSSSTAITVTEADPE